MFDRFNEYFAFATKFGGSDQHLVRAIKAVRLGIKDDIILGPECGGFRVFVFDRNVVVQSLVWPDGAGFGWRVTSAAEVGKRSKAAQRFACAKRRLLTEAADQRKGWYA